MCNQLLLLSAAMEQRVEQASQRVERMTEAHFAAQSAGASRVQLIVRSFAVHSPPPAIASKRFPFAPKPARRHPYSSPVPTELRPALCFSCRQSFTSLHSTERGSLGGIEARVNRAREIAQGEFVAYSDQHPCVSLEKGSAGTTIL
jgi:hypothetical protein